MVGVDRTRLDVAALARESAGLMAEVHEQSIAGSPEERIERANRPSLLGSAATPPPPGWALPRDGKAITRWFALTFPEGLSCTPGDEGAGLRALNGEERQTALAEAVAYARDLGPRRAGVYEVTALCEAGELKTVFLMPRRAARTLRLRWRHMISYWNIQVAASEQLPS
jgi:hypothetical protein